jgi:hypothetical protein
VAILGLIGALVLARRWPRPVLVAAAPAVAVLLMCTLIGAGKPSEFARFLIVPAMLLCGTAGWALTKLARKRYWPIGVLALLLIGLSSQAPAYFRAFKSDASVAGESRHEAGQYIGVHLGTDESLGVIQEPAPYAIPPVDFAHQRIELLPDYAPASMQAEVLPRLLVLTTDSRADVADKWWRRYYRLAAQFPDESSQPAPLITWANKLVLIFERVEPASPGPRVTD